MNTNFLSGPRIRKGAENDHKNMKKSFEQLGYSISFDLLENYPISYSYLPLSFSNRMVHHKRWKSLKTHLYEKHIMSVVIFNI